MPGRRTAYHLNEAYYKLGLFAGVGTLRIGGPAGQLFYANAMRAIHAKPLLSADIPAEHDFALTFLLHTFWCHPVLQQSEMLYTEYLQWHLCGISCGHQHGDGVFEP